MTAKYFAILTNQGAARLANAAALGTKLNLTQMAVGDANGTLPTPAPAQTKLINQKRIAPLNLLTVDPANTSQIIAEQIIPENEGGFWIREIGLYDDDGILIAVANCPETYKPQLQEGSGRTQTIRMILIVSSTSAITLKIDPSVVLATRQYVDDKVIEVKAYADDLMKNHLGDNNPHEQYLQTSNAFKELADKNIVSKALENLGLGELQSSFTDRKGIIAKNGGWGLGIIADQMKGTMASLDVTRFDYFAPADNIGPYPGKWAGGVSFANSGVTGWQIVGASQGDKPDFSVRIKNGATTFSDWYQLYHSGNKPSASDIGALSKSANLSDLNDKSQARKNLGLDAMQNSYTDKTGGVAINGGWGLGIIADQMKGTMASLDVTRFDYFAPADNIGPYPGQWSGGLSFANSGATGWQIVGASLSDKPDFSVRIKTGQTTFSNWYKLYHSGNKPSASDVGALSRESNLADLPNINNARSNLGLGTAAIKNVGTGSGQVPDMSSFASGTNWMSLPGGTIIQRGISASGQIGDPLIINFPVPFTDYNTVQIVASYDNAASANAPYSFAAQPISNTQFKLLNSTSSSAVIYARWIAIGR
ncbi:phage tail protein [Enterobacter hormaechei]|uniref:phage tail protein n=1 Tax=Enterobacter hormaechei TaxID=158836 RepID=UPI003A4C6CE1